MENDSYVVCAVCNGNKTIDDELCPSCLGLGYRKIYTVFDAHRDGLD